MNGQKRQAYTELALGQLIERHVARKGALLPILHDAQHLFGHIPAEAVPVIAEALNLSRADVHGVITFYHDFKPARSDRPVVKLCRAEACQARGVETIATMFEDDDRIMLEPVYCLGLCASGPAAMVGTRVFARLDQDAARRLLDLVTA